MRGLLSRQTRWFSIAVGACLLVLVLLAVTGRLLDWKCPLVLSALAEGNKYEVRSQLLMEAMNQVGAFSPESAAETWASGLQMRSAALQYSVMSNQLKDNYARQLERSAPNWVTGMSSPWVDNYRIVATETPGEDLYVFDLIFSTATSTGPAGDFTAVLTVAREGYYWRITMISADGGLYPYTRYNPEY